MRTSSAIILALAVIVGFTAQAWAEDTTQTCLEAVEDLHTKVRAGEDVSWEVKYAAYKKARSLKKGDEACEAAYAAIQSAVADGLRREDVPLSGWLMGLFGAALLWGGMTTCIVIAFRSGKSGTEAD